MVLRISHCSAALTEDLCLVKLMCELMNELMHTIIRTARRRLA